MPGTPERPKARIYADQKLAGGARVELAPVQTHHLRDVLRLGSGDPVAAFNQRDGEWLGRLALDGRHRTTLGVAFCLRPAEVEGDLWLLFAPIKRGRIDWLVEKATELGVSVLWPVWTARTQVERLNHDRLRTHAIQAAEQSERLSVPELRPAAALAGVLAAWPAERQLIVCDETGGGERFADVAIRLALPPVALLIGPEGGFDQTELDALTELPFVSRVGLGPRALRADTAAVAALAAFQAIAGDWRRTRIR